MTIPKQMIDAGKAAIAHRRSDPSKRKYFIDDRHVEQIITAALATIWSDDMDSAPRDGTRILLSYKEQGILSGHWEHGAWQVPFWMARMPLPSAWAPLPTPKEG